MKNVLVTGVSTGIGNTLTKRLIKEGFKVWGIARRETLLRQLKKELNSDNFFYTSSDISQENFWFNLIKDFKSKKFILDIVVFNAAINENDLSKEINLKKLRQIMEINFFSILEAVKLISRNYDNKLHFITISSTSALKGNYKEGIGYAASKAALSIAFECLYQKHYHSKIDFTTIFLGPVKTDMIRFTKVPPFTLNTNQVSAYIVKAIREKKPFYYYPKITFMIVNLMRLLPKEIFFRLWTNMQKSYINTNK